jgi:prophage regulatory protein
MEQFQFRALRTPEVLRVTGLSKSTIWRLMKAGKFPRNVKLGPKAVGWLAHDIDRWFQDRVKAA